MKYFPQLVKMTMSRKSNRHRRHVNKSKKYPQKVVVILVEGETEQHYLSYIKSIYNKSINLDIFTKSKLTSDIKVDIEKYAKKRNISTDELLLVYDLEHSDQEYRKFINNNELVHRNTYLVQPCIEAHFLMHFKGSFDNDIKLSPAEVEILLKRKLPKYRKGPRFDWRRNNITKVHVDRAYKTSLRNFKSLDDNFFSMIGLLIDEHFIE